MPFPLQASDDFPGWLGHDVLGLDLRAEDLSVGQMSARAAVAFVAAMVLLRFANKRFMGRSTALDLMLGITFGSVVGAAVTGRAPFVPALAACLVFVVLHTVLAALACRWHRLGVLLKGRERVLVKDGQVVHEAMRRASIGQGDLNAALRSHGVTEIAAVKLAVLERNGDISLVLHVPGPSHWPVAERRG